MTTQTSERPVVADTPRPPTAADIVRIYRERGFTPVRGTFGRLGVHCPVGALARSVGWDGEPRRTCAMVEDDLRRIERRYGVGIDWLQGLTHGFDGVPLGTDATSTVHAGYAVGREAARLLFDETPL